ncbi:hypothetical protein VNI00_018071 [Paramarasmius palmivorus]|uniref:Uncharacterized protein n=1 Tax=Paramarasmius palmivorus TaxID=297713 RepID=A0AAW0B0E1_9AGAR
MVDSLRRPASRQLSSKARHARDGVSLLDRLDNLSADEPSSEEERLSDESYNAKAKRRNRRAVRPVKNSRLANGGSGRDGASVTPFGDDVLPAAETIGVATDLRSITDSEDELPSPSTIFSSTATRASSGTLSSISNGNPSQAVGSACRGGDQAGEGAVPVCLSSAHKGDSRLLDLDPVDLSPAADAEPPLSQLTGGSAGLVKSVFRRAASEVFSSAISLLDDEAMSVGEDELDEDPESTVSPLLSADCIHPDLQALYASMGWLSGLRRSQFIGYPNTERMFDDFSAVSFGGLLDKLRTRVRSKLLRSMVFVEYRDFKNPTRVPLTNFVRSWECVRVPHSEGQRNAVFVLTGVSTQSFVGQGREIGQSCVKQLYVRPLENDWEILQSNIGSFFNDSQLHAPGRRSALVFQTKRQGWVKQSDRDKDSDSLAAAPYSAASKFSGARTPKTVPDSAVSVVSGNVLERGSPAYRSFDDGIPLYDGRTKPGTKGFQFGSRDWESYSELPSYPFPEVEENSLVTVAFTLTGFRGNSSVHHTVHFNALFAIVLGKVDD